MPRGYCSPRSSAATRTTSLRQLPDRQQPIFCLVPADVSVIHDTWHTGGLRATGSNDIEVTDVFVPVSMTFRISSARDRRARPSRAALSTSTGRRHRHTDRGCGVWNRAQGHRCSGRHFRCEDAGWAHQCAAQPAGIASRRRKSGKRRFARRDIGSTLPRTALQSWPTQMWICRMR